MSRTASQVGKPVVNGMDQFGKLTKSRSYGKSLDIAYTIGCTSILASDIHSLRSVARPAYNLSYTQHTKQHESLETCSFTRDRGLRAQAVRMVSSHYAGLLHPVMHPCMPAWCCTTR